MEMKEKELRKSYAYLKGLYLGKQQKAYAETDEDKAYELTMDMHYLFVAMEELRKQFYK
mgnify:CR=1 FL=1